MLAGSLAMAQPALAQKGDSTPKPKVDCSKAKNRNHSSCKNKLKLDDEELFRAGYWLAREGQFAEAIEFLSAAKAKDDPRILTYLGFANRKLGHMDVAMGFYQRALAADPDYVIARAYLGEAWLQRGERARAGAELVEIERRCGQHCEAWKELAEAMAKHGVRQG
jgi:tetratricopeptide (TPR) repeat protein